MERLTDKQVDERVKDLATEDFLATLTHIAKLFGWESDYIEVCGFVEWIYGKTEHVCPTLEPYEIDDFDNTIIP